MRRLFLSACLLVCAAPLLAQPDLIGVIKLGGPLGPDGRTEVACDLPVDQRIRNIGSHVDGLGMCVTSSIEMAARWSNIEEMRGFRDWCAKQPGGAYPEKVDRQAKQYCTEKKIKPPGYIQYQGSDPSIIKTALQTGRMVGVTYSGADGVRYRGRIAHMVCAIQYSDTLVCLLDNNAIGNDELLWMSVDDFLSRWKTGGGGWAFIWLAPPPPPVPWN